MENNIDQTAKVLSLEDLGAKTFWELADFYSYHYPEKKQDAFSKEIFEPMLSGNHNSDFSIIEEIMGMQAEEQVMIPKYQSMLLSCAYSIEAGNALTTGHREAAWSNMAAARYWCGVALASVGLDGLVEETKVKARKDTARKGGLGRAKKFDDAKHLAFKLVKDLQPIPGGWASRLKAAERITPEVLKGKFRIPVGENRVATVYEWLKEMPDANLYFPEKKQGRKKIDSNS